MESRWSRLGFTALPLKRFYKYLLKRLIGGFLRHDIDLEQLEVQLYKGIVQLKSLELDVAQFNLALLSQGLLLHFASGMVGCVKMDIPWRNLLSDHCKVFVSGLHVSLAKGLPADVSAEWPLGGGSAAGGGTDLLQARQTGPNSVSNSLEEKSRYSEEGVETLSRLVKLVLSRMEICLHDASVTVSAAPEARSALRARISSVVLFSDGAASETGQERTIRVRGISLSVVPEEAASPLIAASKNASQGGEVLLASTEAEAAAPSSASSGVLMIRQTEGFGGFHLDVSLSLPSIRIALAPRSWRALSECLVSLSQVVRRAKADPAHGFQPLLDAVAPAEQPGEEQPPSRSTSFQAPPSMVRSLVESTLPGNQTPARFWHELYGLFEADAQLEDDASVGEGLGASESQAAEDEDEEAVDAITGSGREGESASTAAGGTGQLLGITLKVDVASAAVLLCLSMARSEGLAGSGERLPAPADVQLLPGPSRRLRGDQAQLCLQGLSLSLSKELSLGQPGSSGSVTAPVAITSAQSVAVHLHKFNVARCADDDDAGAESPSEEEAAEADEAYVAPSSELFHSMLMASASSAAPNAPSAFRTLAASDMFRSARSTCPLEAEDGARTPSAPSVHCSTHESLDAAELTDDSDAESFGESSVHSLSQGSDAPAEDVVPAEIQEEVSGRSAPLNAASAPSPSGGARGARKAPRAAVIQSVPEELEQLFFDRAQPIREVLLPGLSSGSEVGAEEDPCGLERSGRWRRRAPHFSSKQVLQLLSPEGPGGGGSSSSRDSGCAAGGDAMPPLPLPGSNHPIWASLRPPAGPAVQKVWAEWSAASPGPREDAFQRVGGQLRIGCQAALVSLCVESLQMLAAGTAALGRQSSSKGASSTELPQRQNQSGLPVAHSLPSIVAVSPLLRVVVQLSKGGCAICDTVLPRISTPQPQPGERNTDLRAAAGSLSHQELLRFDAASAGLRLLSEEPDHASTTISLLSVGEPSGSDANTSGSEDLREPGFTLSCHVAVRRDAAVAGDDNDSSSQVQQPQPSEAVVAFAAAASADLPAPVLSDWTKISVPKAKVSPGRRPGTPSGTAEAEGADPLAQEQEQPGSSSRAGQAGTERGTLGGDGSSGVSRQAKVELELSVPASLRLFAHTGSLHRIKDEVAVFASRLAREVFAASPSAPSDIAESELAPIGVTVLLGDLTCDLIEQEETQTRDDSAEGQANRSGSESCTAHPKDAIQVSLANLNCRVVQLPGPSLSFCALGGDLRFELVSEVSLEGERGPSSTRCSNILLRPWFQPNIRSASTQSQRQSTRNEVPSAGYPWEVQHARARQQAVLRSFLAAEKGDRGEWQDSNSLLLLARQRRGAKANITLCSLVFSRLVVLAQHSLLERTIRRLIHMAKSTQAEPARTVDEERAAPKEKAIEPATGHVDLQISMLDCLVDFPSLAYALQWPITSPHGLNVPLPPPVLRGADADMWRAVLHAARITVSLNNAMGLAKGLRFRVADANLYLVDHPHNLGQLDLLSSAAEVREFLVRAGFAHILELSAASASWQPPERGEGSAAELTLKEELVDLDLGQVSGHLRADTVKCLQSVAAELAELLPQPQLQAASAAAPGTLPAQHAQRTQQQRMAPLATSLPSPRPLQNPAASAGRPAELPRRAPAQTAAEEDQGILQSIDMFAFSPPVRSTAPQMPHRDAVSDAMAAALGEDLLEDVGDGEGNLDLMPEPRPLQAFRSVSSTSCLIDDYIRTQELQQSPRQPVRACPASPFSSHDGFEMELLELPEAEDEAEEDRLSAAGEAAAEAEAEAEELSEAEELRRALQSEQVGDIFQDRSSRKPVVASGSSGGESSTSVAVCLFDPEAFDIEELRSEDWSARRELERMFAAAEDMPLAPLSPHQQLPAVNYQDGSAAVWYVDPAAVQVVQDHFVRRATGSQKFEAPSSAPPLRSVVTVHCSELTVSLYRGTDFQGPPAQHSEELPADRARKQCSNLTVQLTGCVVKLMRFCPTFSSSVVGRGNESASTLSAPSGAFSQRLVVCARDFAVLDNINGSVFSHLLAYFEDEKQRPRPSQADMLYLRVDELVPLTDSPAGVTSSQPASALPPTDKDQVNEPEFRVEVRLLPLRLTVDQDAVDFLADFMQLCALPTWVEEDGELQDLAAAAGLQPDYVDDAVASPGAVLFTASPLPPRAASSSATAAAASLGATFFQKVVISGLLLSVDYRAKRLDVDALRRGELWELVNLLPLLEGLQVAFRSVTVSSASGVNEVLSQVVAGWSTDLNRTQILRSLTGVTPIRSFANIGGGFAEMVLEPLKQYRTGSDREQVSRTMLRGLISFLRHVTIESIDLTERVIVGAQAALEFANSRIGETPAKSPATPHRPAPPRDQPESLQDPGYSSSGSGWLPVERGAAHFRQPDSAAAGLQEARTSLTRGLRTAGPFLVRPLLEFQRGAPREQVLRSMVSGIPMCVLRPALGATAAATTALRGVRNSVDPLHRREMVSKYKGPG